MLSDIAEPELTWIKVCAVLLLLVGVFYGGYAWRDNSAKAEIAKITAERANERAAVATSQLSQTTAAVKAMHDSAMQAQIDVDALRRNLSELKKERSAYVKSHPLPVDCFPGDIRVQQLEAQRAASNHALSAP